ncbi:hypothetical protein HHI36_000776 [Cryptolaemus montrouzieri]|uniref:Uncharacterized protein n=1 Tax=Cryptolaemus montrouzieri TaxID=559131 RepID=A0ABD2P662_9CUCU
MELRMVKIFLFSFIFSLTNCQGIIKDVIQYNIAGIPILHKTIPFPFDPDAGSKRSIEYQAVNGRYGEKAIERLGLGTDGRQLERLEEQRRKDEGQLGGVRDYLP